MAVATERDHDETRHALAGWLADRTGAAEVEVGDLAIPGLSGFSNETILFDAFIDGEPAPLALRVEPTGHQVFPSTAFDEQARVLQALGAHSDVPVPRLRWFEDDPSLLGARFLVMDRVQGEVPADNPSYHAQGWLADLAPDRQRAVWCNGIYAMAAVHVVDTRAAGLDWIAAPEPMELLRADRRYQRFACGDHPMPALEAAFARLEASLPPVEASPALCWGDSRIGNVIFDAEQAVAAVLDWEMVTAGDPVQDLAWYLLIDRHHHEGFGVPRLPGLPDREASVALWEKATGRSSEHLWWYELLGGIRYAAVMTRVMELLDSEGILPGVAEQAHENTGVHLLERLLDERA